MMPNLPKLNYVPTLCVRGRDMKGLEYVPATIKQNYLMPCILLSPWVGALRLTAAINRIKSAYPNKEFFLDLDPDTNYEGDVLSDNRRIAPAEFQALKDDSRSFENWRNFVQDHDGVYPAIQLSGNTGSVIEQIEYFLGIERCFCIRVFPENMHGNFVEIINFLRSIDPAMYAIIVEGAWRSNSGDELLFSTIAHGFIETSLVGLNENQNIVISYTSMPRSFTDINGVRVKDFSNRAIFQQIKDSFPNKNIIYGDWGSARPRIDTGGGSPPVPRIDYPTETSWVIARDNNVRDFGEAARNIVSRAEWVPVPGFWGVEMIKKTAEGQGVISTGYGNDASRINIHLCKQALHNSGLTAQQIQEMIDGPEEWEE